MILSPGLLPSVWADKGWQSCVSCCLTTIHPSLSFSSLYSTSLPSLALRGAVLHPVCLYPIAYPLRLTGLVLYGVSRSLCSRLGGSCFGLRPRRVLTLLNACVYRHFLALLRCPYTLGPLDEVNFSSRVHHRASLLNPFPRSSLVACGQPSLLLPTPSHSRPTSPFLPIVRHTRPSSTSEPL